MENTPPQPGSLGLNNLDLNNDDFVHVAAPPPTPVVPNGHTPPQSQQTLTLSLKQKHAEIGLDSDVYKSTTGPTNQYVATITASPSPSTTSRQPVSISVALDTSGSMSSSNKLNLCKKTLLVLIEELKPDDTISLVTFSDEASEVFPLTRVTSEGKESMSRRIKSIRTSGCTNISGGLGMAVSSLLEGNVEGSGGDDVGGRVKSVLLLTDGHANRGVSDSDKLVELVKGMVPEGENISINTFGYGSDHNADLLKSISESTQGNQGSYYYVENEDNVSSAFGDCLGGLLSVVAQNITLRFEVGVEGEGGRVEVFNIRHDRAEVIEGGGRVRIGDIFAEESKDFIADLKLATTSSSTVTVTGTLNYLDINTSTLTTTSPVTLTTTLTSGSSSVDDADTYVVMQDLRLRVSKVLEDANRRARNTGRVEEARGMINEVLDIVKGLREGSSGGGSYSSLSSSDLNNLAIYASDLTDCLGDLRSYNDYERYGSKKMMTKMQSHARQRCNESDDTAMNAYRGSSKMEYAMQMKSKMKSMF